MWNRKLYIVVRFSIEHVLWVALSTAVSCGDVTDCSTCEQSRNHHKTLHFDTQKRQVGKRPVRSSIDQTKVYVTSQRLAFIILRYLCHQGGIYPRVAAILEFMALTNGRLMLNQWRCSLLPLYAHLIALSLPQYVLMMSSACVSLRAPTLAGFNGYTLTHKAMANWLL